MKVSIVAALRHKIPAGKKAGRGCGDTAAAGDEQLGSCTVGKMKYTVLCGKWQVNPRGDVPSVSLNRWPYLRGSAEAGFNSC